MDVPSEPRLLYYPDPRLREVAAPISEITPEIRDLVPKMFEIMRRARGIGLAGTQVGFAGRIIVASIVYEPEEEPLEEVYVNPKIVDRSGEVREDEGCLSLPGLYSAVDRYEEVTAEYRTLEGEEKRVTVAGLHAKLFQHEIDHLDGILMLDKMSPAEKKKWATLLAELEGEHESGPAGERPPSRSRATL